MLAMTYDFQCVTFLLNCLVPIPLGAPQELPQQQFAQPPQNDQRRHYDAAPLHPAAIIPVVPAIVNFPAVPGCVYPEDLLKLMDRLGRYSRPPAAPAPAAPAPASMAGGAAGTFNGHHSGGDGGGDGGEAAPSSSSGPVTAAAAAAGGMMYPPHQQPAVLPGEPDADLYADIHSLLEILRARAG